MKKKNKFKIKLTLEIEQRFDVWNASQGYMFPRGRDKYMALQSIMVKCALAGYKMGLKAAKAGVKDEDD